MNDLIEAKLTIARIKVKVLDLAGALAADDLADKDYAISKLLELVDYIEVEDVRISEITPEVKIDVEI